ncbi:MAG: hypothetical protein HY094_10290 [Candidatus Melainabacteria bacterium]|nr:hypothetical protein [Candidatus Melainabacteria bacterium]
MGAQPIGLQSAFGLFNPVQVAKTKKSNETIESKITPYKAVFDDTVCESIRGGWQVLKNPANVLEIAGTYVVEFNPSQRDLSLYSCNERGKLLRLQNELTQLANSSNVKHLIVSFFGCHSLDRLEQQKPLSSERSNIEMVNGPKYFADYLTYLRNYMASSDKKLSLVHLEKSLYENLQGFSSFIHETVSDAIQNNLKVEEPEIEDPIPISSENYRNLKLYTGDDKKYDDSLPSDTYLP